MKTAINYFGRMLCAFLLSAGVVLTSCEESDPINNGNNTEQGGNQETPEPEAPATITLENVTYNSATFTGHLNVDASDLSFSQVTIYYSDAETFNMNSAERVSVTSFDKEQNFTIALTNLKMNTKYNYCMVAEIKSEKTYGDVLEFTTPYPFNISSAIDLSSSASANCYIVSKSGEYKFKPVKGNSTESVGEVSFVSVLWETFGTSTAPSPSDLIECTYYADNYIAFQVPDSFKEGNAVIAAMDAEGTIIWSWHIWLTDEPEGQEYFNNAGTMMDRNLGATSATPGDVGALGLLYQWGRKDPFLGSSNISKSIEAKSTISWPEAAESCYLDDPIAYTIANPTTFIKQTTIIGSGNYGDWYYTGDETTGNSRWTTSAYAKSIYDPCPVGWRVPDGGYNGVWSKALGIRGYIYYPYDDTNRGMNLSGKFGSASTIWYPAVGAVCIYWSASLDDIEAFVLYLNDIDDGWVWPATIEEKRYCHSVRCIKEVE